MGGPAERALGLPPQVHLPIEVTPVLPQRVRRRPGVLPKDGIRYDVDLAGGRNRYDVDLADDGKEHRVINPDAGKEYNVVTADNRRGYDAPTSHATILPGAR